MNDFRNLAEALDNWRKVKDGKTPFVFRFMGSYKDTYILVEDSLEWLQTSLEEVVKELSLKKLDFPE